MSSKFPAITSLVSMISVVPLSTVFTSAFEEFLQLIVMEKITTAVKINFVFFMLIKFRILANLQIFVINCS